MLFRDAVSHALTYPFVFDERGVSFGANLAIAGATHACTLDGRNRARL
jgi:hypothetical protein